MTAENEPTVEAFQTFIASGTPSFLRVGPYEVRKQRVGNADRSYVVRVLDGRRQPGRREIFRSSVGWTKAHRRQAMVAIVADGFPLRGFLGENV